MKLIKTLSYNRGLKWATLQVHTSTIHTATWDAVKKIIKTSACRSSGSDPVPALMFNACLELLLPIVTIIINQSLMNGVVTMHFKRVDLAILIEINREDCG